MFPILLRIGAFELSSYGVGLACAFLVPLVLARWLGARLGIERHVSTDLAVTYTLAGFAGAKALGIVVALASGVTPSLRDSGAVHGGVIVGLVAFAWRLRAFSLRFEDVAAAFAPTVAFGQVFGRIGCLATGCCFGTRYDGPLAIRFTSLDAARLSGTPLAVALHPVQLYDAAAHLALTTALVVTAVRAPKLDGRLSCGVWLIAEGVTRAILETWRGDLERGASWLAVPWLSTGRITSGAIVAGGVALIVWSVRARRGDERATA